MRVALRLRVVQLTEVIAGQPSISESPIRDADPVPERRAMPQRSELARLRETPSAVHH